MSNFEKQIKQQGDAFSIEPREQVWHRVEAELNKKKDRRIAGWWWITPIALLLAGGVFYYGTNYKENKQQQVVSNNRPSTNAATTPDRETSNALKEKQEQPVLKNEITAKTSTKISISNKKNNGSHSNDYALSKKSSITQTNKNNTTLTPTSSNAKAFTSSTPDPIAALDDVKMKEPKANELAVLPGNVLAAAVGKEVILQSNNGISSSTSRNDITTSNNDLLPGKNSSTTVNSIADSTTFSAMTIITMDSASESTKNIAITKPPKEKINWRLLVSGGFNNNTENQFLFSNNQTKALSSDPMNNTSGGSNSSVGLPGEPNQAGGSLAISLQRLQWLSKRWQWQAGMGAQYHQIQQTTGIRKDSAISQSAATDFVYSTNYFYLGGNDVSHKGENFRMYLSSDFSFALLKNKRSLLVSAGIYSGLNLYDNYLVPDYTNNRYVKSEDLYHKWFAGVTLGVEYNFKKGLAVGLHTKRDLTKSFTTLGGDPQYWQSFLLNFAIPLSKK